MKLVTLACVPTLLVLQLLFLKERLDLKSICMMGHSFGGATSMLAMDKDKRISYVFFIAVFDSVFE